MIFDLEKPEAKTSKERYVKRVQRFVDDADDEEKYPKLTHHLLWLIHNCIAHPMLGLFPGYYTVQFHNLTSNWLNLTYSNSLKRTIIPKIPNKGRWIWHNVVSHMLIGLVPCKFTFQYHDRTAEKLGVPGWV